MIYIDVLVSVSDYKLLNIDTVYVYVKTQLLKEFVIVCKQIVVKMAEVKMNKLGPTTNNRQSVAMDGTVRQCIIYYY